MRDSFLVLETQLELLRSQLSRLIDSSEEGEVMDGLETLAKDLDQILERVRRYSAGQ